LIDAMEGASIESGGGVVRVRDDHHFDLPMFLAQFNDGELSVRKSLGLIRPPDQRGD
jgi:branched-chain amino acid transport system substrate-binding protein/urea transport system substrate-binding protein